ncbi:phage terminase, large subunit, PBSX family [Ruminococcus sp. YE71]|nr:MULTISPECIES: PBSX family phage terminase large subunit [unclassified Ruminococcus]SDA11670.1 phage terminase, large subunit, PBSX family [Ruminococcus sp. YE78]SFW15600.1 phage terminase, large subunit, PBSX family [Ruminococcus sp. YE71]
MAEVMNFSPKQKLVFSWWKQPYANDLDGIICDGAVRSGKTMCMAFSFVLWSMTHFSGRDFAICGKTIGSVRRNIVGVLSGMAKQAGMAFSEKVSRSFIDISFGGRRNRYYIFGGRDESSASLIQGMTLSGVLFDECALMPRSFVEQAVARCSVSGSKIWFNCNPESSGHWFKREWIDKAREKHLLHLHFTMEDNPSLSRRVKDRYRRMYTGAFYDRFVLGKWSDVSGLIYPMFGERCIAKELPKSWERHIVSCDYGTVNPSSFGLWGLSGGVWYRISEYYFDSRREGMQRTDEEHYAGLERLCSGRDIECVICDPSAASFIECVKRHGKFRVKQAKNDVVSGIRRVADALSSGSVRIGAECGDCIREFGLYRWDDGAAADKPLKENDHAMDDVRYFVGEITKPSDDGFFVMALERQ